MKSLHSPPTWLLSSHRKEQRDSWSRQLTGHHHWASQGEVQEDSAFKQLGQGWAGGGVGDPPPEAPCPSEAPCSLWEGRPPTQPCSQGHTVPLPF